MILRTWRGAVRAADADRYLQQQDETGVRDYREADGNLGAIVLRRDRGDRVEVVTLSLWETMDAVRAFAGPNPGRARFYPGDDDLLIEKDLHADHYDVVSADLSELRRPGKP